MPAPTAVPTVPLGTGKGADSGQEGDKWGEGRKAGRKGGSWENTWSQEHRTPETVVPEPTRCEGLLVQRAVLVWNNHEQHEILS